MTVPMIFSPALTGRPAAWLDRFRALGRAYGRRLGERSKSLVMFLDLRMEALITAWVGVTVLIALAKVSAAPVPPRDGLQAAVLMLPYLLVALAPIAGFRLASGSFPRGLLSAQPAIRLCRYGTWRQVDEAEARGNPGFGPSGFMASLLLGILLNVPVRSLEFFSSVPAIGLGAPFWAQKILLMMTLDAIVMNFCYMVCFVLALRSAPLFPRMLVFAWLVDVLLQLVIAREVAAAPHLPAKVAEAMSMLLDGNVHKVLISAAVWLPYLILSERVNVTFRRRIRA